MDTTFLPPKYFRGKKVLEQIGDACKPIGDKVILISGEKSLPAVKERLVKSLEESGMEIIDTFWYGGECSWGNINELSEKVSSSRANLIISIGGGKSLDTGKAVAYKAGLPVVTVPTIAATCAPFTPLSIIHTPEGFYLENCLDSAIPQAIFADTEIIASAPDRLLFAGMGDTLAKWYELRATTSRIPKTSWTIAAVGLAKSCYDVIVEFGPDAKVSVEKNESSHALEQVVDAIIWHAGMSSVLGGDKCRGAAAHAIYFGFTNIDEAHKKYHGELVGYGNLCLLELEGRPEEEIIEAINLAKAIGVPITLDEICSLSDEDIQIVAKVAVASNEMGYMPVKVEAADAVKAIYAINEKGKVNFNK